MTLKVKLWLGLCKNHAMKMYGGNGDLASSRLNCGTKCMFLTIFTPRPLYLKEKSPHIHCIGSCMSPRTYLEVKIKYLKTGDHARYFGVVMNHITWNWFFDYVTTMFQLILLHTIKYEGEIWSTVNENVDFEGSFQTFWRWLVFTGTEWLQKWTSLSRGSNGISSQHRFSALSLHQPDQMYTEEHSLPYKISLVWKEKLRWHHSQRFLWAPHKAVTSLPRVFHSYDWVWFT